MSLDIHCAIDFYAASAWLSVLDLLEAQGGPPTTASQPVPLPPVTSER